MTFSIKDFFSKCDQILNLLRSHLLKKFLMENFIFCVVKLKHIYRLEVLVIDTSQIGEYVTSFGDRYVTNLA